MKKAVFYSRVSTTDQIEGTSLESQKAWCLSEISKNGMAFVQEYSDRGQSGADENRPAWQALLSGARCGKFDAVFVYDIDRFTRDMLHGLTATGELRALGITLHDAKDATADAASADAQLMTGFRLLVAEEERRKIKERTVRGQRAKLEAGKWPGGKPCFGWKLEGIRTRNAQPVVDTDERKILEQVFVWLVRDAKSTSENCDILNATGVKSRTGLRWSHAVLRKILSNPTLHTGWFIWGSPDKGSQDSRSHKTKVDRDGRPIYGLPGKVNLPNPPFTQDEFHAVQRALNAHPRAKTVQSESITRPLSGRIFGNCGRHYTGTSIKGKGYDVYRCTGNRHRGNETKLDRCGCSQINAQKIEDRVWTEVSKLISDEEKLQELAKIWLKTDSAEEADTSLEESRLSMQEQKTLKAINLVQDDYYFAGEAEQEALKARIEKYRLDLKVISERRKVLDLYQADAKLQSRQLASLADLARLARGRIENLGQDEKRQLFELLRLRVVMSEIAFSEPSNLTIYGQIDDRILNYQAVTGESLKFDGHPELAFVLND